MEKTDIPSPFADMPAEASRVIEIGRNECLFRQDDMATGMYYLESGTIELQRQTEAGDRISVFRAHAGQTFAEASLFSDSYHCDAVALTPARIRKIDKDSLLERFRNDPSFALSMASRFVYQLQASRRRIEVLTIRSAGNRVLDAVRDGLLDSDIKTFAATIGLTHEATYRTLSALARSGSLIKTGRGRYRLP